MNWIPISERLPEDGKRVLINFTWDEDFGDKSIKIGCHNSQVGQWSTDCGFYYHDESYKAITHWMPLPPLPQEDNNAQ